MGDHAYGSTYHTHNSHAEWAQAAADTAFETEDDRAKHRTFLIIGSAVRQALQSSSDLCAYLPSCLMFL